MVRRLGKVQCEPTPRPAEAISEFTNMLWTQMYIAQCSSVNKATAVRRVSVRVDW
jgi:hypothetical protein